MTPELREWLIKRYIRWRALPAKGSVAEEWGAWRAHLEALARAAENAGHVLVREDDKKSSRYKKSYYIQDCIEEIRRSQ